MSLYACPAVVAVRAVSGRLALPCSGLPPYSLRVRFTINAADASQLPKRRNHGRIGMAHGTEQHSLCNIKAVFRSHAPSMSMMDVPLMRFQADRAFHFHAAGSTEASVTYPDLSFEVTLF